jgi:hypothetical protein
VSGNQTPLGMLSRCPARSFRVAGWLASAGGNVQRRRGSPDLTGLSCQSTHPLSVAGVGAR